MWRPVAHSDHTDQVTAQPVLWDAEHAPLEFSLDAQDQAHAAAARHDLRRHVERLNAMQPIAQKALDKA